MRLAALAALLGAPATTLAQDVSAIPDAFTDDQCSSWLGGMLAADSDGSGGLSGSEFASFLSGIEEPPYLKQYFDGLIPDGATEYSQLPWMFQVVHASLACRCHDLGLGEGCCASDEAEVPLAGFAPKEDGEEEGPLAATWKEYRSDLCAQVAAAFDKTVDTPSPTPPPTGSPTPSPTGDPTASPVVPADPLPNKPDPVREVTLRIVGSTADYSSSFGSDLTLRTVYYLNAEDVANNVDDNQVLSQFTAGLSSLAADAAGDLGISLGRRRAMLRGAAEEEGGRALVFGKSDLDIANEETGSRAMQTQSARVPSPEAEGALVEVRDVGEFSASTYFADAEK